MSATTLWGCASRIGGLAVEQSAHGETIGGHSYDELALELPDRGVALDLDHQPGTQCGTLVYGEVADDGRLNVVAVLDDDWITRVEEDVFWSPEMEMVGDVLHDSYVARLAELRSLALTLSPLTVGAQPVRFRSGDVRSSADRQGWEISWRSQAPLLARAVDHLDGFPRTGLRHRSASRLVDLRQRDGGAWHGLREGDPAPADLRSRVLPNGYWRSGHAGRILSVR
jgi:hypothetical protein